MSAERRAVEVGRRLDLELSGKQTADGATDPYMAGWLRQFDLSTSGLRVEFGVVVDVVPGAHCYRVALGRAYVYCSPAGSDAGFGPAGVRPTHTLPLLARVFVARHPETPTLGTIVGVEPHWSVHTGNQPADSVWPFTRSGTGADASHSYPFESSARLAAAGEINVESVEGADLSAGRPYDATAVGEWGRQAETGVGIHVDPFHAYLRVDEATGVFAFYDDQLLRVAGVNYQFVTTLEETEQFDDAGELGGWTRRCVYAWEPYGLWRFNQVTPGWSAAATDGHGLAGGQGVALLNPFATASGTGYAVREPEQPGQLSAARLYDWTGYLGQGGHSVVAGPAQLEWAYPSQEAAGAAETVVGRVLRADAPSGRLTVDAEDDPGPLVKAVPANSYGGPAQPGLFEEHRSIAGRWTVRTARGLLFSKRPSIPTPRPLRQPPDPGGDSAESGYAAAGLNANAAVHAVRADPTPVTDAGRRMCLLPDAVAYLFNWENLHPFAYHELDWSVAQEGAAGAVVTNQIAPDYDSLTALDALAAPAPVYLDVDHRYGPAPVYENESLIGMLDDGSIVLRDGWGSEIRMGGGHIELRAAGDVRLHAGRDTMVWAGYDVVLKAHNSVDVTAANGDVRTKAEYNSFHLAGNSGCGGFLFESKAECPSHDYATVGQDAISSGFVVRCPASTVDVVGADVRIAVDDSAPDDARITLDSGDVRSVYFIGKQIVNRVAAEGGIVHVFDDDSGNVARADEFRYSHTLLGGDLLVDGYAFFNDCVTVNGWVSAVMHFASSTAATYDGLVGVSAALSAAVTSAATDLDTRVSYLKDTYAVGFDAQTLPVTNVLDAEFTCRTAEQYRSESYVFWRGQWEAIAAADGQALTVWIEPTVVGTVSSTVTRPFPGERWTESGGYKYQAYTYVDPGAGWLAVDRDALRSTYETGSPAAASSGTLQSLYKITVPNWNA